jgi:hypothetical protein
MFRTFIVVIFFALSENFLSGMSLLMLNTEEDKIQLTSADVKKLSKADKESQKAQEIMKDADKLYADIAKKQADLTSEETENLNNKALAKQIEAAKNQKNASQIRYDVYNSKAEEFWKRFKGNSDAVGYAKSLETSGRSKYQVGLDQFKEGEGEADKLLAYSKMGSANEDLSAAVDNMKRAFEQYAMTSLTASTAITTRSVADSSHAATDSIPTVIPAQPVLDTGHLTINSKSSVISSPVVADSSLKTQNTLISQTTSLPDTTSNRSVRNFKNLYQAVQVNEEMVDRFNKFMIEKYPQNYEKFIINFNTLDFSDIDALRAAWDLYLYGGEAYTEQRTADTSKVGQTGSKVLAATETTEKGKEIAEENHVLDSKSEINRKQELSQPSTSVHKNKEAVSSSSKINSTRNKNSVKSNNSIGRHANDSVIVKGFIYKVQIAACRVPLNEEILAGIYHGPEKPLESFDDDEWYKYQIGSYNTFAEAKAICESTEIKGAFVVAYLNGRRINNNEALITHLDISNSFIIFNIPDDVKIRVQVAACRNALTSSELHKIYNQPELLDSIFEDGWYKYGINCGNNYGKACQLLKEIGIAGAFVAVYKNNVKISIKTLFDRSIEKNK